MQEISRRDFMKLAGIGAATTAVLTGCGGPIVFESQAKTPELVAPHPFSIANQFYLDGRRLNPDEVEANIPNYARDYITSIGSLKNNIVVEIFTGPQDPNNPDDRNRKDQAVTVKVPGYVNEDKPFNRHQLYVRFADIEEDFQAINIEYNDENNPLCYKETFYDPKTNRVHTISKVKNNTKRKYDGDLAMRTDPLAENHPPIPDAVYNDSLPGKLANSLDIINKTSKYHFEVSQKEFDPETNRWVDRQKMLPGSLWHAKLINLLTIVLKDKKLDQEQTNKLIKNLVLGSQNAPKLKDKEFETELDFMYEERPKYLKLWREYFRYFGKTVQGDKLLSVISTVKHLMSDYRLSSQDMSVTQLAELVELLSYSQDFLPDFNYTGSLFKTMFANMLTPPIFDKGGIFFQRYTSIAGWLPINKQSEVLKQINGVEEQKAMKNIFDRVDEISENIINIEHNQPLYLGLTQLVQNYKTHEITRQYVVARYNYDNGKVDPVFVFDDQTIKADYFPEYNPNDGKIKPFDIFQTDKFQLPKLNLLTDDLGMALEVDNGQSLSVITEAVMLSPHKLWRRKNDWGDKFLPFDGIPMIRRIDENKIANTRILFPGDNLADAFLLDTNNMMLDPSEVEWISDITDLYETAKRMGQNIFNNVAFGGLSSLIKKMTEGQIKQINNQGSVVCSTINPDLAITDPDEYRKHIWDKIFPSGTSLAIVARDTQIFSTLFTGIKLPFGGATILRGIYDQDETPNPYGKAMIKSGEYVVVNNIVFLNEMPYAQVQAGSQYNTDEIYIIPLQDLLLDSTDNNLQKAALIATLIATFYVPLRAVYLNPAAMEVAGKLALSIFSMVGESAGWLLGISAKPEKNPLI